MKKNTHWKDLSFYILRLVVIFLSKMLRLITGKSTELRKLKSDTDGSYLKRGKFPGHMILIRMSRTNLHIVFSM